MRNQSGWYSDLFKSRIKTYIYSSKKDQHTDSSEFDCNIDFLEFKIDESAFELDKERFDQKCQLTNYIKIMYILELKMNIFKMQLIFKRKFTVI